jgi:hypothetical protein
VRGKLTVLALMTGYLMVAPAIPAATPIPPGVRTCAPRTTSAPTLTTLVERVRAAFGPADAIRQVHISAPPRWYWGRSYPPANTTITRHSPWVYVVLKATSSIGDRNRVAVQRGSWQADLLVQALHAAICAAGQRPELGYSIRGPGGADGFGAGGAIQGFPRSYAWPFARVDARFIERLHQLAHRYRFRVQSVMVVHGLGDAPEIQIESDHPAALIHDLPAVERRLYPASTSCWTRPYCLSGDWLEAVDARGSPFVTMASQSAIGTGVGGWGSQWVRAGLPYPFPHA